MDSVYYYHFLKNCTVVAVVAVVAVPSKDQLYSQTNQEMEQQLFFNTNLLPSFPLSLITILSTILMAFKLGVVKASAFLFRDNSNPIP